MSHVKHPDSTTATAEPDDIDRLLADVVKTIQDNQQFLNTLNTSDDVADNLDSAQDAPSENGPDDDFEEL